MIPLEIPDTTQDQRIDLLDRQDFVDQIHNIALTLARNKKSKCYAINGGWGVGKSYVLDMFEEQAQKYGQEGTTLDQYLIFRYNCWEYDYYEEPLIAIVACILEQYEEKVLFLDSETKSAMKETLLYIGKHLLSIIRKGVKATTKKDIKPVVDAVTEISENTDARIAEERAYDTLFAFKTILRQLRKTFASLSEYQTVVIIVDELDRCLPEYTIKVLERLHHLFDDIPNVQVILSIDRSQLAHAVKQIYGAKTNVRKYLDKFIDFEISLPIGSLNDSADSYFDYYYTQFENQKQLITPVDLEEFKRVILEGIDTRSRIAIIEKCNLLHGIMSKDESKSDIVFMAIQMFLAVLKFSDLDPEKAKRNFVLNLLFEGVETSKDRKDLDEYYTVPGLVIIREKIKHPNYEDDPDFMGTNYMHPLRNNRTLISCEDLWGILLATYRAILGFEGDVWHYNGLSNPEIKQYALDYWKLLNTIT